MDLFKPFCNDLENFVYKSLKGLKKKKKRKKKLSIPAKSAHYAGMKGLRLSIKVRRGGM